MYYQYMPFAREKAGTTVGRKKPSRQEAKLLQSAQALLISNEGIPPTAREIASVMGLTSATVYTLLRRLKAKGWIERRGSRRMLALL